MCSTDPSEAKWANDNPEYQELGVAVYTNYDEMLAQPGLQAVWISTSTDVHASQSLAAIAKGVHVLCEKPLSTDIAEVRKWPKSKDLLQLKKFPIDDVD